MSPVTMDERELADQRLTFMAIDTYARSQRELMEVAGVVMREAQTVSGWLRHWRHARLIQSAEGERGTQVWWLLPAGQAAQALMPSTWRSE